MIIINIELNNPINLNTLLDYHKHSNSEIICKQIGYDDKIYILLKNKIYKKQGKIIRKTSNKSSYSTLILTVGWDKSELTESKCISLGIYNKDFSKIQPINNKILLVKEKKKVTILLKKKPDIKTLLKIKKVFNLNISSSELIKLADNVPNYLPIKVFDFVAERIILKNDLSEWLEIK